MDVCWNGFQMDPGGSRREVTKELCKVHIGAGEGAVKSQTIYFGGICPSFINVIRSL